jgi:hypothetical protein
MDLSQLKFKELDTLSAIFKLWSDAAGESVDMEKLWDLRLRQLLADRIESKEGVFDMDYHFRLAPRCQF